jgi:phage-related minor tail protein
MTDMLDRLVRVMAPLVTGQEFDRLAKTHQAPLVAAVRAVLAELREPTDAMLTAGFQAQWTPDSIREMWQAMVDAIRDGTV